jgi:hypothetical protein
LFDIKIRLELVEIDSLSVQPVDEEMEDLSSGVFDSVFLCLTFLPLSGEGSFEWLYPVRCDILVDRKLDRVGVRTNDALDDSSARNWQSAGDQRHVAGSCLNCSNQLSASKSTLFRYPD